MPSILSKPPAAPAVPAPTLPANNAPSDAVARPSPTSAAEAPKASKPSNGKAKAGKPEAPAREVCYPKVEVRLCDGPDALTAEQAKVFAGYVELEDSATEYLYEDCNGRKVQFANNNRNRMFDLALGNEWKSEVLRKHWSGPNGNGKTVNGDTMTFDQTGEIISAQHRLYGLIEATKEWAKDRTEGENRWRAWDREPVMDTIIVLGVDGCDEVVNTTDTGKPRSLDDCLYRSHYFADLGSTPRAMVAKMASGAIRMLWKRTRAMDDAMSPRVPHGDFLDFFHRHPKLDKCLRHLFTEDGGVERSKKGNGLVSKHVSAGYASALMYLMAASETDPAKYYAADPRDEAHLKMNRYRKAEEFWVSLLAEDKELAAVRDAKWPVAVGTDGKDIWALMFGEQPAPLAARIALLARAWQAYSAGKPVTAEAIHLEWSAQDEDGKRSLQDTPLFGGVDKGDPKEVAAAEQEAEEQAEEQEAETKAPEVQTAKAKLDAEKEAAHAAKVVTNGKAAPGSLLAELEKLKEHHGDKVLICKRVKDYVLWADDARLAAQLMRLSVTTLDKVMMLALPATKLDDAVQKITGTGRKVAVIDGSGKPVTPATAPEPVKPAVAKPPTKKK